MILKGLVLKRILTNSFFFTLSCYKDEQMASFLWRAIKRKWCAESSLQYKYNKITFRNNI